MLRKLLIYLLNPKWVIFIDKEHKEWELGISIRGLVIGYDHGRIRLPKKVIAAWGVSGWTIPKFLGVRKLAVGQSL